MTYGLDDPNACARLWDHLKKEQTLVSENPIRIRVTVSCNGAELYLTLDGDLTVMDVAQDGQQTDRSMAYGVSQQAPSGEPFDGRSRGNQESVDRVDLPDKQDCLQALRRHRWPDGITCPHCGSIDTIKKGSTSKDAQRYKCHSCNSNFNDLTGTLFAGHRLSLPEMFHIIREMDETETAQIARQLGRSYKSILAFVHEARDVSNGGSESTVAAVMVPSESS